MDIEKLRQILAIAAIAPGNQERFLACGLLCPHPDTGALHFAKTWYPAFQRLSPLPKETVRANPGLFLVNATDLVYRGSSSGSRSEHFVYFAGTTWNQTRQMARQRALQWWGLHETTPVVNVASRLFPVRPQDVSIVGPLDVTLLDRLLEELAIRPSAIRGYPSRLCEVAALLKGIPIPPVVAVICTGEGLYDFQIQLLREVFAAPVINEYGCQEVGISGMTCPGGGRLHLDDDRCLYEVIDGQLVATDLFNSVMPLVRYQCGDVLELVAEPCSCGRPGPTAQLLGRTEDWVRTVQGKQRPGEIKMPALPNILTYQVIRESEAALTAQILPDEDHPLSLDDLAGWVQETFGEVAVQLLVETASIKPSLQTSNCSRTEWIAIVTQGNWADWLQQAKLPAGELRSAAALLQAVVFPHVITYGRLSAQAQHLLTHLLQQAPLSNPQAEWMSLRILCFLFSQTLPGTQAQTIYQQVFDRMQQVMKQDPQLPLTGGLDLLIATLLHFPDRATFLWPTPLFQRLKAAFPKPDTLTIQHLLYGLEAAVRRGGASPYLPRLRPLLAVLIGDLESFADRLSLRLLSHWCEMLQGYPMASAATLPSVEDAFLTTWLHWRQQFLYQTNERHAVLQKLGHLAQTPQEHLRVTLERGYDLISTGQEINPEEWLPIVQSALSSQLITPVAWAPILRPLAQALLKRGQHSLAYECLLAATIPSVTMSAFEQGIGDCNNKQSVLSDRGLAECP